MSSTRGTTSRARPKRRRRWIDYPRRGKTGIRRWLPSWRLVTITALLGLIAVAGVFIALYQMITIPDPNDLLRSQTTTIAYADGSPIARLYEQDRTNVDLSAVPLHAQQAVLSAENRGFYTDPGISISGAGRALWVNLTSDSTIGGSTITQQYVKNMYLTQERSWERKVKEVFISLKIEREMTKSELLQDYLNTIYFGRGAYGIQAASQAYYGKNATDLTVSEGALLAARIQNPSSFDSPDRAADLQARWGYVLDGMVAEGWLSSTDRAAQVYPTIRDNSQDVRFPGQTGYLVTAAQNELAALGFTEDEIQRGGLRVTTTFEPQAQAAAEAAIAAELPPSAEWPENFHAALAAVRPSNGRVAALYGGRGYQAGAYFDDAIQGAAQPGSTFKPFALAAGLENGVSLRDRFNGANDRIFEEYDTDTPVPNFGGTSFGFITMVTATANSVNTAYVDLTIEVGADKVVDTAVRAGIPADTQDLIAQPSVVLGVANVHPVDLANAYATLAAGGQRHTWHVIKTVVGPDGEQLYAENAVAQPAYDPDVVADITYALQAVVEDGSGFKAQELGRPSAGKTGTTNDNRSSWYAGYVPQLAASVALWEEGADASLTGFGGLETVTGGSFPASVWTAFMEGALAGTEVVDFPEPAYVNTDGDDDAPVVPPPPPATTPATTSAPPPPPPTETETPDPTPTETETVDPTPTETPTQTKPPPTTPPPPDERDAADARARTTAGLLGVLGLGGLGLGGLVVTGRAVRVGSLTDRDAQRADRGRRPTRPTRRRH